MSSDERARRIPEVLERVGLLDRANSKLREFSKGMQQRVGLAQAILHNPELVILDEPTSALDPLGRRDVRDIVMELRSQGKTVLLNSHLLSEIEMTCDQVAIIKKGKVATQGTVKELLGFSSLIDIEVEKINSVAMEAIKKVTSKIEVSQTSENKFTAWIREESDIPEIARALVHNNTNLIALTPRRETLESLFMRIVEEK